MSSPINKEELRHLAELARLELSPDEEDRLLHDLQHIVEYVTQLQEVDTASVSSAEGSGMPLGVFRDDRERENTNQGKGVDQFPEKEDGYLRVPPVL